VVLSLPSAFLSDTSNTASPTEAPHLSWAYNIPLRLGSPLARQYRDYIERTLIGLEKEGRRKFAALVLEPFVMGAGGMIFVDPLFQRIMVDVVRDRYDLPIIFDEVFVGLYRLGMQSPGALLGVNPDISVNAKILTGGLLPLAVTLASDDIFQAFKSENKTDALLHGHSYTAHPVGCEVANETLKILDSLSVSEEWNGARQEWSVSLGGESGNIWSFWDPAFVGALSYSDVVAEVMTMGTLLKIRVRDDAQGKFFLKSNSDGSVILIRVFILIQVTVPSRHRI
jgi:dethiobiotin synthetase/adenosylmethionine--8-amino-7-oxononanoate aminotransferase